LEERRITAYVFRIPHSDWELEIYEPILIETRQDYERATKNS